MTLSTSPIALLEKERAAIDQSIRERTSARRRIQEQIDVLTGQRDALDEALQDNMNSLEAYDQAIAHARAGAPVAIDKGEVAGAAAVADERRLVVASPWGVDIARFLPTGYSVDVDTTRQKTEFTVTWPGGARKMPVRINDTLIDCDGELSVEPASWPAVDPAAQEGGISALDALGLRQRETYHDDETGI